MRIITAFFLIIAATGWHNVAAAETVQVKNDRGEKVKFCTYRSDDKSLVRARKCWMLDKGQTINWVRGAQRHSFDVRLFGPGVFELPICMRTNISESYLVKLTPRKNRSCLEAFQRTKVPPQIWADGSRVLVNRLNDNYWYPGTVLRRFDDQYRIRFDDGRLEKMDTRLIADFVLEGVSGLQVNWKRQGRWYPVQLKAIGKETVRVVFEDGKEEDTSIALVRLDLSAQ